jgi:ubiquinone/menaquinone biosynthesis C-methylase UbiE
MNKSQKEAFVQYEADAWFERNKSAVLEQFASPQTLYCSGNTTNNKQQTTNNKQLDFIMELITRYNIIPNKVLEIGSSAGYRLNRIKEKYPESENYGIDPSVKAIEFGKENYPKVNLQVGFSDSLPFENKMFDVVIIGFVFYVLDRELLFQTVAEIDRVLKNNGFLIIIDFFSEKPRRNEYAHIKDFEAWCFKQEYEKIFTSSQLYHLIDKTTLNHNTKKEDASSIFHDLMSVTMLRKDCEAAYK